MYTWLLCFFVFSPWLLARIPHHARIIGGAAVVGGILTAILLSKGSKAVPPVPGGTFPDPPARP